MVKRGDYFYSKYNDVSLRFTEEWQEEIITKTLKRLEDQGWPINKKTVHKIIFDKNFSFPGFWGYQRGKEIHINPKKIKRGKILKTKRRMAAEIYLLLAHELIHAYDDKLKWKISKDFQKEYWECLETVRENIGSKLFEYKDRKSVFNNALPLYRKIKKWDPWKRYDKRVKKLTGIPTTYALMAPHEFVAEIFSNFFLRSSSIKDKKLKTKIKRYWNEIINKI